MPQTASSTDQIRDLLQRYWGYDSFRPLQGEAVDLVLRGRDSVVVLPTGGGKSLCYQVPALALPGVAVVVSPLISLMKDQVDALTNCGVPAAFVNSTQSPAERLQVAQALRAQQLKLLYVSPEKLTTARMLDFLANLPIAFFAIDEAHCISSWGHDFRPEYRALRVLKERFPQTSVHAYTATATEVVRADIARELLLQAPEILVGNFDRPNLTYRVQRRTSLREQLLAILEPRRGESGILYCNRRAEVDELAAFLNGAGFRAVPYHAGMSDHDRKHSQEAFIAERVDLVVATMAFGMGIDKSNVRFVIHTGAPKSLEAYQQESGRAGRDGLDADCWLFYTGADFQGWRKLQADLEPDALRAALASLRSLEDYCHGVVCRHRQLVEHFGQAFEPADCQACDVCLSEFDAVADPLILAQKILSCVVRLQEKFGEEYTAQVLAGSRAQRIRDNAHDQLSTWGLLAHEQVASIRAWIAQLVSQAYLAKDPEYGTLRVTPAGRDVLRGTVTPRLAQPVAPSTPAKTTTSKRASADWTGVDRPLFDLLRSVRRARAEELGVPAFIIFGDATLRELARHRPSSLTRFRQIHGIGDKKCEEFGPLFLPVIREHCETHNLPLDA